MHFTKDMQEIHEIQSGHTKLLSLCQQLRSLSLYGVIFFIPLSIAFSDICLSLLLLSYIIEALMTRRISWPTTPINRPLLAFILLTVLLTPFAVDAEKSFSKLTNLIDVAIFFLLYMAIKERRQLQKYVAALLLSMSIGSLYGVLQHYLEIDLFRLSQPISFLKHVDNDLSAPVRISGFSSYMTFGGQLAMIMPFIFAYMMYSKGRRNQTLWGLLFIINGSALIWTYTRSAWLGAVLGIIVVGYLARGKRFWKQLALAILVMGIGLILQQSLDYRSARSEIPTAAESSGPSSGSPRPAAPGFITQMLDSSFVKRIVSMFQTKNNRERLYTWQSSFHMFADYPLTGIGHGNYSKTCQAYRTGYGDFEFTSRAHAHNTILQIAVLGGLPLLGAFLWLWIVLFRSSYQTYRQTPADDWESRSLALGSFGALIAFSVHGIFEHNFGDSEVLSMLWILCSLSLAIAQGTTEKPV